MFDYFQVIKYNKNISLRNDYSFLNNTLYKNINCIEFKKDYSDSFIAYLEQAETRKNSFEKDGMVLFVFGTVYTNKKYESEFSKKPEIIYAEAVYNLFKRYDTGLTDYIKGSFVIVVYDSINNNSLLISDRLNVLPLYYSYSKDYLVISSSLRMILNSGLISKELNYTALTEQIIFDYTLGTKTYFKNINRIDNGSIYRFNQNDINVEKYWTVENLYNKKLLPRKKSLDLLSEQLYENTNLYCSDSDNILIAVTGGFDGRANLALLNKNRENFICYSYGMSGSQQVEVPKEICKKLDYNFNPILLDNDYEKSHDECTLEAIEHSNATAPILRSNYPYAYKRLNAYSRTILTGLFGSEVMRPLHNLGIMMNDYSEKLFLSDNPEKCLKEILEDVKKKKYLKENIIDESFSKIWDELYVEFFDKYKNYNKIYRFFFFILQEGVRKYFSQEIQIERPYVTTRFPFFDDDFVELMYKTPFAGMYNGFLGKSKFKRRKGQLLYAHIYRKYKPELGKIRLDRGYKPDDLLKPFPFNFFSIYRGIKKTAEYKKTKANDTFNSEKWTINFIKETLKSGDSKNVFDDGLRNSFENKSYLKDLLKYSHLISLLKYFNSI